MRIAALSILAVSLVFAGCAAQSEEDDADMSEDAITRALEIGESGNGKTFTVAKGKDIKVGLPSNATTGYKWKVVSTSRTFGYPTPKDGKYEGPGAGGPVGGGGKQSFVWKTTGPLLNPSGTAHAVKLEYRRSFESDEIPAAKTFTFKIKIKAGAVEPPAPEPGAPITIKESQDGDTVRAKVGQGIVLRLPENPSSGYRWHVESTDRTFGHPAKTYEGSGTGAVGASGTAVMTWTTGGPLNMIGSHTVKLKYSRGETGTAAKSFSFTVAIVAAADEDDFVCPPETMRTINCMPLVPATRAKYCKADYRTWAQANCDVSYLD